MKETLSDLEAGIFLALAHPTRVEIIEILRAGEQCVCHLQAVLGQRQAYISQHLNTLRGAGLVTTRKEGQRVYYTLRDAAVLDLLDQARKFLQVSGQWQENSTINLQVTPQTPCTCPQCSRKND